VHKPKDKLNLL